MLKHCRNINARHAPQWGGGIRACFVTLNLSYDAGVEEPTDDQCHGQNNACKGSEGMDAVLSPSIMQVMLRVENPLGNLGIFRSHPTPGMPGGSRFSR